MSQDTVTYLLDDEVVYSIDSSIMPKSGMEINILGINYVCEVPKLVYKGFGCNCIVNIRKAQYWRQEDKE